MFSLDDEIEKLGHEACEWELMSKTPGLSQKSRRILEEKSNSIRLAQYDLMKRHEPSQDGNGSMMPLVSGSIVDG